MLRFWLEMLRPPLSQELARAPAALADPKP